MHMLCIILTYRGLQRPVFKDEGTSEAKPLMATMSTATSVIKTVAELQANEEQWPPETRIVYKTARKIGLKDQSLVIRMVINKVISAFEADLAFGGGIFAADKRLERQFIIILQTLRTQMKDVEAEAEAIAQRVEHDYEYAKLIADQVRVSYCLEYN